MWILDSANRGDGVDLWYRDGTITRVAHHLYDPPFFLHLPDPGPHHEMIGSLEEAFGASPCTFTTIFGELPGYRVFGDRNIAETIERQTGYTARLFNVDVRRDQRFMAERGLVPCSGGEGRFSTAFAHSLRLMEIRIRDNPALSAVCTDIEVTCGSERPGRLRGSARTLLADLFGIVAADDPDVILMPGADAWMPRLQEQARAFGFGMPFSRSGKYRTMDARSYWSYGRMEHKASALIPDGRILIDTEQSFVYREGGLAGVFMGARLAGISPNLASRFTPGTLISGYEVYEAVGKGIAVPFRKSDVETTRKLGPLKEADRGGMMFQPAAGTYENVDEIDFTSLYPSIIIRENLSPETIGHQERRGFLTAALEPLVKLRIETKRRKKADPELAGIDSILKWMLVTCFGYTGYKNAKFGRIEVHEGITRMSREILMQTKAMAEGMGFTVLHGIVDSLWVQGTPVAALKERVEHGTGLPVEVEHFDWIVFLPQRDKTGAYNRYYGRLGDGSVKVRGIAARRHDTPEFIRTVQQEMLTVMSHAGTVAGLALLQDEVREIYLAAVQRLPDAEVKDLVINRRISRLTYGRRCLEGAAVQAYLKGGTGIAPGMKIGYVVRDARTYAVDTEWEAEKFDVLYYRGLLEKAWEEIRFAFRPAGV